jgi:serine/threonine protein kinase
VLTSFTPPLPTPSEPTLVDAPEFKGYRILKRVGQGGMSRVYLAQRESDNLLIALKVLDLQSATVAPNALANNQIDRFVQEYALVSRVNHPNIVRIFDQGFTDDHAYIAMEYFDAGDVKQLVKKLQSAPPEERRRQALAVVAQAAAALVAVHAEGITHRDIKPENLMFRMNGSLALADFGIAKHTQQATLTQHGFIVGTPLYLSPEQACGQPATAASDLYSLGVIFYEVLTGELPFAGDNVQSILAQHMIAPVPKLPASFADLQPLVDWLLAKEASLRCSRAAALVERLRA